MTAQGHASFLAAPVSVLTRFQQLRGSEMLLELCVSLLQAGEPISENSVDPSKAGHIAASCLSEEALSPENRAVSNFIIVGAQTYFSLDFCC